MKYINNNSKIIIPADDKEDKNQKAAIDAEIKIKTKIKYNTLLHTVLNKFTTPLSNCSINLTR